MTSRGIFAPVGLVLVLLPQVSGCLERSDPITGVRVVATWSGIEPDQLSYALVTPDGSRLGAPEVRPAEPAGPLTSGATVVVYLGHDRADQPIRCDIEALAGGRVIAVGSASVVVARLKIVELPVVLTSSIGGGAPRDGGAEPVLTGHGPSQSADDGGAAPASIDASADAEVGSDSAVLPPPPPLPDAAPLSPDLPLEDPNKGKPRGSACQSASECASGHCTDGVCCAETCVGACRTCAGTQPGLCTLTATGAADPRGLCMAQPTISCATSGLCDGRGNCANHPGGTVCGYAACDASTHTRQAAATCNGMGACITPPTTSCAPYRCDGTACFEKCSVDTQCVAPALCHSGTCRPPGPLGAPCVRGAHCTSGNCVDGVCCDVARCPTCSICNRAGAAGTCQDAPGGSPCPSSCSGAIFSSNNKCDGRGRCRGGTYQICEPYLCNASAPACFTSCTTSAECCCGLSCEAGKCI